MGIKHARPRRIRDIYDPSQFDQHGVDPADIPRGAPTHCAHCQEELTPLRRVGARSYCTRVECLDVERAVKASRLRLVDLHKQGPTVVFADGVVNTSKRGAV